jgi:hypothetical protein
MQWLIYQMVAVAPMMGRRMPSSARPGKKFPTRSSDINARCAAFSRYWIANIVAWSWVQDHDWSGVSLAGLARLQRWHDVIAARPAVQRGNAVPPMADLKEHNQKTIKGAKIARVVPGPAQWSSLSYSMLRSVTRTTHFAVCGRRLSFFAWTFAVHSRPGK